MAELITGKVGKEGYSFTGEISERVTHLSPAILNLPFDNTLNLINNILSPSYASFSSWSGSGVTFQNRVSDNSTFGPFFGNDVYRCEKYGSATNFAYYINNVTSLSFSSEYIVFTCVMKSSLSNSSNNPFSISITRGNRGGAAGEYTTGEIVWRRDEYLTDNFWRIAVCARLRPEAVPSQYRNSYSFEISATWASAGTYVWGCAPMVYNGTELFGYSPTIATNGDYILDPSGFIIDAATTNYMDLTAVPSAWDAGTIATAFWYKNVQAYKVTPGAGGLGITYAVNPALEIASGSSATFSVWVKKTAEVIHPLSSFLLAGAIWETSVWTTKTDMSSYISVVSREYFDQYANKLSSNKDFAWCLITLTITNTHVDKIRFSQISYYNSLNTRGEIYFGAPQLEPGSRASWFTASSRSSQGSISIPCNLKAPYTICFKYHPTIKLDTIVDAGTSPTLIQLGTYNANASLRLQNLIGELTASGKGNAGSTFSQSLKTFSAGEWNHTEYLYTIVAVNTTTFKFYLGSTLLGTLTTPEALTYITAISLGVMNYAQGIYRDLAIVPRALAETEIGDVGFSIKRTFDSTKNKDVSVIAAGRELKEPVNLLVSNWISNPLHTTGVLDSIYSSYVQANCSVFLTRSSSSASGKYSYCVKRPPGILYSAQNMWGGVQLNLPENAKLEGRKYRFIYKYKGQTTKASETPYLAYSIGWTSYGVGLTSQTISGSAIPANTNTKEWKIASGTYTVFNRWQKGTDNNIYDTYRQLKIGWGYEDTGALGTKIFIDDIQIYDITDDSSLVAFYTSSAESSYPSNTVWDMSGNGYNYTTVDLTVTKDGPSNKLSGYFNGTSSKASNAFLTITPPCSISFWMKPKRFPTTGSEVIFHSGTSLGTTKGYWIALKADGVLNVGVPTSGSAPDYDTSTSYLALDTLYHLALNFYPDRTELYKNGGLTHTFSSGMSSSPDTGLVAGQDNSSKYYMGNISDTRIYSKVLPLAEIAALYSTQNIPTAGDFRIKKTGVYSAITSNTNQIYLVGTAETAGDITVSGISEAKWDNVSLAPLTTTGLCLLIWGEDGVVSHKQVYNVASVDADRNSLASKLATIQGNQYWALVSYASCGTNTTLNAQLNTMGALQYTSYDWSLFPNSPYVAFGFGQTCIKEDLRTYGNDRWYATLSFSL